MAKIEPAQLFPSRDELIQVLPKEDIEILDEIARDLGGAISRIRTAAKKWTGMREESRQAVLRIVPRNVAEFFGRLEKVESGELLPELAMAVTGGAKALSRLPVTEQRHYLSQRIPVLMPGPRGRHEEQLLDPDEMSRELQRQVFELRDGVARVRTPSEQRAWLKDQEQRRQEREEKEEVRALKIDRAGWEVRDQRIFLKPHKVKEGITKRDLEQMRRDLSL